VAVRARLGQAARPVAEAAADLVRTSQDGAERRSGAVGLLAYGWWPRPCRCHQRPTGCRGPTAPWPGQERAWGPRRSILGPLDG
jgi:hypothetical protein